ncbi:hypothetical protein GCM10027039_08300 [Terrabacter koreensis]
MTAHADALLRDAREELARADNKASLLLTASGVGVGALLAALLARSWSPSSLSGLAQAFWWAGAIIIGAGIVLLGTAVYPKTSSPGRTGSPAVAYYADVVRVGRGALKTALQQGAADDYLLDQLFNVSEIVVAKYRAIGRALWSFGIGLPLMLLSLAVNAIATK